MNFKEYRDELLFVPLGGSNEIGMNFNCYHFQGKWLLVDLGIGFADDHLPGVDVVVPNIDFILEHKDNIVGLVLTHAHEDHLGAVPYLWQELQCPIYATRYTKNFLHNKLVEVGLQHKAKVHEVEPGAKINLAPFSIEMVPLTHSIPEMQALAIGTSKGLIMHTGDWKLDPSPVVGPVSDEITLKRYGDQGLLALVCDSTNVFEHGVSGSEGDVRKGLAEAIASCSGRVAITTFASNLARIESIIHAARDAGRIVVLAGRSLKRVVACAIESGYLTDLPEIVSEDRAMDLARSDALIICTGSQGEPMAALSKIARGEHHSIRLAPGDTVIFSSRKIPGNEKKISWIQNSLVDKGIEIITDRHFNVHASGHPARDELKRMYELTRPRIAVPVHGEWRHLHEHAKLAKSLGVPFALEPRNGHVLHLDADHPRTIGAVESGYLAVDGNTLISADSPVIKMRRRLRDEGCVLVSVVMDTQGELMAQPAVSAPGALDSREDGEVLEACAEEAADALRNLRPGSSPEKITETIRGALRRVLKTELGKKPTIEVHILRV